MKKMMFSLILAAVAFALPCLADTEFAYCSAKVSVGAEVRVFYSEVFSYDDPHAISATFSLPFSSYVEATYENARNASVCWLLKKTRGEARAASDADKASNRRIGYQIVETTWRWEK